MHRPTFLAALVVAAAAIVLAASPAAGLDERRDAPSADGILYVALPPGPTPRDAVSQALALLASRRPTIGLDARVRGADIVVFTRPDGTPVRPELERGAALGLASNEIAFTFDSPAHPWTLDERAQLDEWLDDFYPAALVRYGAPAFAITVNVRKDPNIESEGYYFASSNEIVLSSCRVDVFCHEMVHAFRDDAIISNSAYEEGMTRAMEVVLFNEHEQYPYWDRHHSEPYFDVNYEMLNKPEAGCTNGNVFAGINPLLRYQLAGYAWGKAYIENPAFFVDFNAAYYAALPGNPSLRWSEPQLRTIAASVQAEVEALPFDLWYAQQHVLDADPPLGESLYQSWADDEDDRCWTRAHVFERLPSGTELLRNGAAIDWALYDYTGSQVAAGTGITSIGGWIEFGVMDWRTYVGRVKVITTSNGTSGLLVDGTWRSHGRTRGIFGVVRDADEAVVEAVHVPTGTFEQTTLTHGCFDLPGTELLAGPFDVTVRYPGGRTLTQRLTKDASRYYTSFGAGEPVAVGEAPAAFSVRVAPNPMRGEARLSVVTTRSGPLRARLYDLAGRAVRVLADRASTPAGLVTMRIARRGEGPELDPGVYFYRVETVEGVKSGRVMILE